MMVEAICWIGGALLVFAGGLLAFIVDGFMHLDVNGEPLSSQGVRRA